MGLPRPGHAGAIALFLLKQPAVVTATTALPDRRAGGPPRQAVAVTGSWIAPRPRRWRCWTSASRWPIDGAGLAAWRWRVRLPRAAPQPAGDLGVMAAEPARHRASFWFGILLVMLFAVKLPWFPSAAFRRTGRRRRRPVEGRAAGAGIPAVALAVVQGHHPRALHALGHCRRAARGLRAHRAPRALSRRAVLWGHVLRNALVPVVTVMGLQFANLVTGTVVIERVLAPGLGRLLFRAIGNRDLPLNFWRW